MCSTLVWTVVLGAHGTDFPLTQDGEVPEQMTRAITGCGILGQQACMSLIANSVCELCAALNGPWIRRFVEKCRL